MNQLTEKLKYMKNRILSHRPGQQDLKSARKASEARNDILANISHEIRTPLNAILGYNEMILNESRENRTITCASHVQTAGKTLLSMVDNIIDYTDIDKGNVTLRREPYDTLSMLKDILSCATLQTEKNNLELMLDIDEALPRMLVGDMPRLIQIISNLISNAAKYTLQGFVKLIMEWHPGEESTGRLSVFVIDSGIGMEQADITAAPDAFTRFNYRKNRDIQGLGLGIPITVKLLTLMESSLTIESEYGRGSCFSFVLTQQIADKTPVGKIEPELLTENTAKPASQAALPAKELSILDIQSSHILVVDDEPMNLRIAERMLEKSFRVSCVNSGREALEFLRKEIPQLILLDLHMPELDGFQILRILKEQEDCRDIPVIFLTADNDRDMEVKCFQEGALDFITKPFIAEIMISRVKRILELDGLKRNLQQEVDRRTRESEERREKVERMSLQIMQTLSRTIDAKDKYTNGHSVRVSEYSREIARRLGKSEKEQEDIYYMGLLHDIGKIGIPDEIINKPDRLTAEEYAIIQSHPVIGAEILKNISELPEIKTGARWHHERYDGKGYPDGLAGGDIPLAARIIGVADTYDAMTSKRSYRKILPQKIVIAELKKGRGTQFDPVCTDIMLQMIAEDKDYQMREKNAP